MPRPVRTRVREFVHMCGCFRLSAPASKKRSNIIIGRGKKTEYVDSVDGFLHFENTNKILLHYTDATHESQHNCPLAGAAGSSPSTDCGIELSIALWHVGA